MKKSVLASLAVAGLSILGATGAHAQTAAQVDITLSTTVAKACSISVGGTSTTTDTGTYTVPGAAVPAGATPFAITTGGGGLAGAASYDFSCNGAGVTVDLASGSVGLQNRALPLPGGAGIVNTIHYTARATMPDGAVTLMATNLSASATNTSTSSSGVMSVLVTPRATAAGSALGAGAYDDVLTVKVTPN